MSNPLLVEIIIKDVLKTFWDSLSVVLVTKNCLDGVDIVLFF